MSRRRGASRGEDRARLIGAAAACYRRGGRQAMTLSRLRAQADASVGNVYHHLPGGPRDIEDALYLETLAGYQQGLLSELRRHRSAAAGVKSIVFFHLDWIAGNIPLAQYVLAFNASWLSSEHIEQLEDMNARFSRAIADWREPHVAAGRLRRLPTMLYGLIVLGPAQQYGSEVIAKADVDDLAREIRRAGPTLADAAWLAVKGDAG
jgi:AcrR family transcriptional regulator